MTGKPAPDAHIKKEKPQFLRRLLAFHALSVFAEKMNLESSLLSIIREIEPVLLSAGPLRDGTPIRDRLFAMWHGAAWNFQARLVYKPRS